MCYSFVSKIGGNKKLAGLEIFFRERLESLLLSDQTFIFIYSFLDAYLIHFDVFNSKISFNKVSFDLNYMRDLPLIKIIKQYMLLHGTQILKRI